MDPSYGECEKVLEEGDKSALIQFHIVENWGPYGLPAGTGWCTIVIGKKGIRQMEANGFKL
jgi:hypothetical protein